MSLPKVPPTSTDFQHQTTDAWIDMSCRPESAADLDQVSTRLRADAYRALRMRTGEIVAAVVAIVRLLGWRDARAPARARSSSGRPASS